MFDLTKRINRLKIKLAYHLGFSKISSMPKMLNIDPTNHCDLKCPLCPTGLRDKTVERGSMKLEQFKPVVDHLAKWLQSVNLYSWGEPLINKSLTDMIRHTAKTHKIRTITSVHLNNLSDEQVEGLVTSGLDKLVVSIDGATDEVYEKYRVGGNIGKVFTNMRKLVEAKKHHGSDIRIIWNYIVMKHNEKDMDLAKKLSREIGVDITFSIMRTNLKDDILEKTEDNMEKKTLKNPITFCKRPWSETFVNWNGDVFPCGCVVTESKYSMGNVFEQDFQDVWNGEKYVAARKELLDQPNDLETVCHICKQNGYYTP